MTSKHGVKYWLGRFGFSALVILIFLYTAFPFYWALISALKPERELIQTPATFFPQTITLQNFEAVFRNDAFLRGLLNSSVVSIVVVASALAIGSFAAYALGRLKFRGKRWVLYVILSMTLFPQISVLPGLFTLVNQLGMYGSITSLMTTYLIFTLPFTVWVLTSFFRALPAELEQAALVDGCTPFQTFYKILLPLTAPALVTTGLLAFIAAWNEYLFSLTFTLTQPAAQTVTVAITRFTGVIARNEPFGEIMAASVVVTVPLIILVLIFQRRIVQGLTAGAVKG
ncbi:MAG: sugar ABC transporter permease [Candidatus Thermofonsia Clade 1 bacterium]|uniref:Sugar ABC transporter permease n=1 Tax=Candidatus Thermofonsia Clade 1 bacterium TaxID=2364210 RepID=A0A2M8P0Y9_9CHLR|nr:MAG: sugar ABC transporter permease [Candidatus Thermofonsia Clade 1 bacterium]